MYQVVNLVPDKENLKSNLYEPFSHSKEGQRLIGLLFLIFFFHLEIYKYDRIFSYFCLVVEKGSCFIPIG
jgi:hypothetical protein